MAHETTDNRCTAAERSAEDVLTNAVNDSTESQVGELAFDDDQRCTEFTHDHGLDTSGDSDVFGAAVCPHCTRNNPLTGDPEGFGDGDVRCLRCRGRMILDGEALRRFLAEAESDA